MKVKGRQGNGMNEDDARVLQEVQKNTQMAMQAASMIGNKIYDNDLAMVVRQQEMGYQSLYLEATKCLMKEQVKSYQSSGFQELMLKSAITGNTMLNDSTSHIAELMIKGNNRGLTDMWKIMNHHKNAGKESVEVAKELMDFEEKCIQSLKVYL